ncbi:unnamed protein product, partial [Mesorhabditis spiculigera]
MFAPGCSRLGGRSCSVFAPPNIRSDIGMQRPLLLNGNPGQSTVAAYKMEIILDGSIYKPGDTVSGTIYLDLMKHMACDIITVKMFGQIRVYWVEESTTTYALRQTTPYEQKRTLVDRSVELWKSSDSAMVHRPTLDEIRDFASSNKIRAPLKRSDEEKAGFSAGRHQLEFSLDLPKAGLLSTFESRDSAGSVQYWVEVVAHFGNRPMIKRKVLFPVVVDVDLNLNPELANPALEKTSFRTSSGHVDVTMSIPKTGFTPAEPIEAEISVVNGSKKSIKYCTLNILQRHSCIAQEPSVAVKETVYNTPGFAMPMEKIKAGASHTYQTNGRFRVPALPLAATVPDFLVVEYFLQLVLGYERGKRGASFGYLQIPIQIGTRPIRDGSEPGGEDPFEDGTHPSAPPSDIPPVYGTYEFANDSAHPPSYEEITALPSKTDLKFM